MFGFGFGILSTILILLLVVGGFFLWNLATFVILGLYHKWRQQIETKDIEKEGVIKHHSYLEFIRWSFAHLFKKILIVLVILTVLFCGVYSLSGTIGLTWSTIIFLVAVILVIRLVFKKSPTPTATPTLPQTPKEEEEIETKQSNETEFSNNMD